MFETLFSYPNVLARHREGPSADARERYLIHCANQGSARATLLCIARELLVIAQRIDVTSGKKVAQRDIEMAGESWARYQRRRHRSHKIRGSRERFIGTAKAWLRFLELFEEPETLISTFTPLIADFTAYMRDERGLSPTTIRNRCWFVEVFLNALECQHRSFASVAIEDVDAFQALRGKQGWGRVTMATSAKALRAFFRHAEIRGWCSQGIAACIDAPRLFRYEGLPAGPDREEVRRLIDSASGSRPQDIRDYAILLLLAIYGLRSGEVAKLRLGDLDWVKELVSIVRPKQRRTQVYPFVLEAGEAILRYLQQARPMCACAELFVTCERRFVRSPQAACTVW